MKSITRRKIFLPSSPNQTGLGSLQQTLTTRVVFILLSKTKLQNTQSSKEEDMSLKRRNFIKSLGFAGVGAATFSLKEAAAAERPQNWDKEVDVLIIGYGGAGASAAMRAHDEGSQVLVIEKMSEPGGNTSVSSGQVLGTTDKAKTRTYISKLFDYSQCELDPKLLEAYIEGLEHTMDWMKELEEGNDLYTKNYAAFPFVEGSESMCYSGFSGASTGGPKLMSAYRNAVEKKRRVEVWLSCPAKRLITDPNKGVIGVVDELYCDDCHHVHKKSELYCQQCHEDMKLKVP